MHEDQEIYQEMATMLWALMPKGARSIYCVGQLFPDSYQLGPEWINEDNSIGRFDFDAYPHEFCGDFYELAQKLQELPPFTRQHWTHFSISLTSEGTFEAKFGYVEQGDSWPGLFMKGISELTLEEAKEVYIPESIWRDCVSNYKPYKAMNGTLCQCGSFSKCREYKGLSSSGRFGKRPLLQRYS